MKLTPFAKGLLSVAFIGGAISLVWHLVAKPMVNTESAAGKNAAVASAPADASATVGSEANPLTVSLVSFHGYAPALVANGNSMTTQKGSLYDKEGVSIKFVIQDDVPALATNFEAKTAHCSWRTSDFWAQEQPNLRNAKHDGKAVMIVDNTQGGDAIISSDPNVRSVEDLAGKKVAMLQYTPSHGMFIDAVENSSLTARKKQSIEPVFINVEEGTAGVRAAFESGNVDAAVIWDPDLSLALRKKGAHVVYSTKTATNLIYDVMVCDAKVLNDKDGRAAVDKFVRGWMKGVQVARANPDNAVDALVKNEEYFTMLEKQEGRAFIKSLFSNLVWTGLEDNARILGLVGGTNHYERVYNRFDGIYRAAGSLANPNSPVINPSDSFDYSFIKGMLAEDSQAKAAAAVPEKTFTKAELDTATERNEVVVSKPVMVSFQSGSAALNKRAESVIDKEMVPFIESNGSSYFILSGHTDSLGGREANMALSKARAMSVRSYLVSQWEFSADRFHIEGVGPDRPICDESNPGADGMTKEDCMSLNRSTRLSVLKDGK